MYDIFANYLQRGNVDVGFMGGAQIDRYGNINATTLVTMRTRKLGCQVRVARRKLPPGQTAVTS
jgi:acyl CoA:acetate/3-ketoacid CoA transferase beta subunit